MGLEGVGLTYEYAGARCTACGRIYGPAHIDLETRLCLACAAEVEAAASFAQVEADAAEVLGPDEARRILRPDA